MQEASVNPHFLRQLTTLASYEEVSTSEDVYSANGIKLISRGVSLNHDLYERIISHKLRKPLESCIAVGAPVTPQILADTASVLLDASPSLRRFMGDSCSDVLVQSLVKRARYSLQAGTLLKLHQSKVARSVHHGMLVGLLAMGMQRRMYPGNSGELDNLIVASIFHDIGELYLAPELFRAPDIPLSPEEWQQLRAHPVIGHAVLQKMGGIAPAVAELVLEHHERLDGSGYPLRKTRRDIGPESHVLAVAETLARFIGDSPEPFAHAEIALKIIPGEFDPRIVDIVACCNVELQQARLLQGELNAADQVPPPLMLPPTEALKPEFLGVLAAMERGASSLADTEAFLAGTNASVPARKFFADACILFERISRAISSSGLAQAVDGLPIQDMARDEQAQIRLEFAAVLTEVRWRLVELSRQLVLQSVDLKGQEADTFSRFAAALEIQPEQVH